jgi:Rieske Fe-S protein
MAAAWAASGSWPVVAGAAEAYPRSLLVTPEGVPLAARDVRPGEVLLFNYPFVASPAFLLTMDGEVATTPLSTEAKQNYAAPGGVGPGRAIVAFSAICAHKLMYPTPELSFIGVRRGAGAEPAQVIHCCGDNSRYDPAHGARVLAGPAPQPLAAVLLEWDAGADRFHAVGMRGGEMFKAFFEKYAFKLEMALGARSRQASGATTLVQPASRYSKAWHSCRA